MVDEKNSNSLVQQESTTAQTKDLTIDSVNKSMNSGQSLDKKVPSVNLPQPSAKNTATGLSTYNFYPKPHQNCDNGA
jgi:hypothetical protein